MKVKHYFARELESMLTEHLDVASAGWPRLCRISQEEQRAPRVLLGGNIVLDLPVRIDATFQEFTACCVHGHEKFRAEWEFGVPTVGGFVGNAAAIAADLGFEVHIASAIGVPAPRPIREFVESGRFDTRRVWAVAGPTPAAIELQFNDGHHLLLPRRGVDEPRGQIGSLPWAAIDGFAAVVINAGPADGRLSRLAAIRRRLEGRQATLGIVARGDWTGAELDALSGTRSWIFFARHEAQEAACAAEPQEAARRLKLRLGNGPRLVVSLDRDGAFLLNGKPDFVRLPTVAIENAWAKGAGDTLAIFATAASCSGMPDEEALRLAVDAATKRVAGLPLPGLKHG